MPEYAQPTPARVTETAALVAPRRRSPSAAPPAGDSAPHPLAAALNQAPRVRTLAQLRRGLNQATRLAPPVIQCLPSREGIIKELGEPKRSMRPGHGSKKYRAVLDAVEDYHKYIWSTKLVSRSETAQFQVLMRHLQRIEDAANVYQRTASAKAAKGKPNPKPTYMTGTLLPAVQEERAVAAQAVLMIATSQLKGSDHTLSSAMLMAVHGQRPLSLSNANAIGADRGGTSEVTRFALGGGREGFFKENKATLTDLRAEGADDALKERLRATLPPAEVDDRMNAATNESSLGIELVGINPTDAHMANRDVAMWRLDQLLGANVIARAQLATRAMPGGGSVSGSIMEKAPGDQAATLMQAGKMAGTAAEQMTGPAGTINQRDPVLMRLLSKLQLIDLLAFQIDRNPKNFFIQQDASGRVTGITGIDNDFALGTATELGRRQQELPGMSRYVDAELAQKILNIDLGLVELVFTGLLSPAEIDALIQRFRTVQAHLRSISTMLLPPGAWTDAVASGLADENRSYWADLEFNKTVKYKPGR
jgi:hypothetical protein